MSKLIKLIHVKYIHYLTFKITKSLNLTNALLSEHQKLLLTMWECLDSSICLLKQSLLPNAMYLEEVTFLNAIQRAKYTQL